MTHLASRQFAHCISEVEYPEGGRGRKRGKKKGVGQGVSEGLVQDALSWMKKKELKKGNGFLGEMTRGRKRARIEGRSEPIWVGQMWPIKLQDAEKWGSIHLRSKARRVGN